LHAADLADCPRDIDTYPEDRRQQEKVKKVDCLIEDIEQKTPKPWMSLIKKYGLLAVSCG